METIKNKKMSPKTENGNLIRDIYINVIHNEFMAFDGTVDIPRLPVSEIDAAASRVILERLSPFIGSILSGHIVLEKPNPPSEQHSIHLVKKFQGRLLPFCHMMKLDMKFSGDPAGIIERGNSDFYPSYRTDRVYYKSRMIPLSSWTDDGRFLPLRIHDTAGVESDLYFHTYAMFDDINRKELTDELCEIAGNDLFPLSTTLYPFLVFDYFTACLNIPEPVEEELEMALDLFEPLFLYIFAAQKDVTQIASAESIASIFPDRLLIRDGSLVLSEKFRLDLKSYFGRKKLVRDDTLALRGWWKFVPDGRS